MQSTTKYGNYIKKYIFLLNFIEGVRNGTINSTLNESVICPADMCWDGSNKIKTQTELLVISVECSQTVINSRV